MPSAHELLSNPRAMEDACQEIARITMEGPASDNSMNYGLQNAQEFNALLDELDKKTLPDLDKFCAMGREDF